MICMILGCFLGAGFVSGREIAFYFSRFGSNSIWAILVVIIVLFVLIFFFLNISETANSSEQFVNIYFGRFNKVIHFLLAVCMLIIVSSMFAGTRSLAEILNINKLILVILTMLLTFFVVRGNANSLTKFNIIVMPIVLLVLFFICFNQGNGVVNINTFISSAIFSGISYVFINIVSLGLFLLEVGQGYTTKQKLVIALLSSLIIGFFLFVLNKSIISNSLIEDVMPNLTIAKGSRLLYIIMLISIYFGMFTTIISNIFVLSKFVNNYIRSFDLSILFTIVIGYLLSIIGFSYIVGYVYSIIAIIGFFIVIFAVFKSKKGKR